ncbi:MAG: hypothetical protein GXP09_12440 [Gammaproteobacteria bacterium]|nr:hypothetical protein [Gammaproteobacteria bacterium]
MKLNIASKNSRVDQADEGTLMDRFFNLLKSHRKRTRVEKRGISLASESWDVITDSMREQALKRQRESAIAKQDRRLPGREILELVQAKQKKIMWAKPLLERRLRKFGEYDCIYTLAKRNPQVMDWAKGLLEQHWTFDASAWAIKFVKECAVDRAWCEAFIEDQVCALSAWKAVNELCSEREWARGLATKASKLAQLEPLEIPACMQERAEYESEEYLAGLEREYKDARGRYFPWGQIIERNDDEGTTWKMVFVEAKIRLNPKGVSYKEIKAHSEYITERLLENDKKKGAVGGDVVMVDAGEYCDVALSLVDRRQLDRSRAWIYDVFSRYHGAGYHSMIRKRVFSPESTPVY